MPVNTYIVKNKRTDDGGFMEVHKCEVKLCQHPSTYLIELWDKELKLIVCSGCLDKLQQKINKFIRGDIC